MTSIALLVPPADVTTTAFAHAIRSELRTQESDEFTCTLYHSDNTARLQEALTQRKHAIIIAYGPFCAQQARDLVKENNSVAFVICGNIFAKKPAKDERLVNISTSLEGYTHKLFLIFPFMRMIRKALVLYDKTDPEMVMLQEEFTQLLRKRADKEEVVTSYPLHKPLTRRDIMLLAEHHIVVVLSQHPRTTDIQRLARLCVEHKTILYMNENNAVDYGAALGVGLNDVEVGTMAAQCARHIASSSKKSIPSTITLDCQLRINAHALSQQGLPMMRVAPLLSLIEATTMVAPTPQAKVAAYLRMEHIPLE
ncbi:MAG: hypothetical protein PVJ92_01755 [Candidatus Dependentiae bacterium]|jgi:ABC-type uncharacterized transport system substrate-binding protein